MGSLLHCRNHLKLSPSINLLKKLFQSHLQNHWEKQNVSSSIIHDRFPFSLHTPTPHLKKVKQKLWHETLFENAFPSFWCTMAAEMLKILLSQNVSFRVRSEGKFSALFEDLKTIRSKFYMILNGRRSFKGKHKTAIFLQFLSPHYLIMIRTECS